MPAATGRSLPKPREIPLQVEAEIEQSRLFCVVRVRQYKSSNHDGSYTLL